jgi:hypothetical protein
MMLSTPQGIQSLRFDDHSAVGSGTVDFDLAALPVFSEGGSTTVMQRAG